MVTLTVRSVESEAGFVMSALLVSIFIMSLLLAMALPVWHHAARRERESELIFRGEQYARAIALWQRQRPGSTPQDIDTLIEDIAAVVQAGDTIVIMSNGGFGGIHERLIARLERVS